MIYIEIFHDKPEDEDYQGVKKVTITYPNEEDFIKNRKKEEIVRFNGHLNVQFGIYNRKQGFFNSMIEIRGAIKYPNPKSITEPIERKVTKILPITSCVITEYYD